ncbi:pfh1, partial [Symbiodinium necroappetens]
MSQGRLPPRSLANDMFTGYAPERLYTEQATIMEMICASPCITTLVCMTMETRYRSEAMPLEGQAHMARHRLGARGNALTFPLAWEDLLRHLQDHNDGPDAEGLPEPPLLPRSGRELAADKLPENGVPPEVLKVIGEIDDAAEDRLQPQKAATPCDGRQQDLAAAGAIFAAQRARAIVPEGHSVDRDDQNAVSKATLDDLHRQMTSKTNTPEKAAQTFEPLYFATAFCFLFKHGTACPDVWRPSTFSEVALTRRARDPEAPVINVQEWAAAMQRRVEAQFRRDWTFGFTLWNYLFRTMVNKSRNAFMHVDASSSVDNLTILRAVNEIYKHLQSGQYRDINGDLKPVGGVLSRLHFVDGLSDMANKVLNNCEARTRHIPGTHEVRTTMRHQTHSYRVSHGLSVFVTFSPSERDSALMLRLARVRRTDPSLIHDGSRSLQAKDKPALDVEFFRLSPEALAAELPPYDERRAALARDPLACLEGFRTLVLLTLRHIFGVRFCPRCPDCAVSDTPCTDAFGSNATACGGVLGRVDAIYGSIEAQKSGVLHAHMQLFIQCLHQFAPLGDLAAAGSERIRALLQRYSSYTAHVRRSVYCDPTAWQRKRAETEAEWPEYRSSTLALSRPAYQSDAALDAASWRQRFLAEDVEQLQQLKQHH